MNMDMSRHRRTSERVHVVDAGAFPCQLLDARGLETLAHGEIVDLSERGIGVRLATRHGLEADFGSQLMLRSLLPGTSWALRRPAKLANRRADRAGEVWGFGWHQFTRCGAHYSNYQRWRFETYLNLLREGQIARKRSSDLLSQLDRRIHSETHSLLQWVRRSSDAMETLCRQSERSRSKPQMRPSQWQEDVFDLVDPRFPDRPCQGRVLQRFSDGFDALLAVGRFPSSLQGRELWALHRAWHPGQRRKMRVLAVEAQRVCEQLWQVAFESAPIDMEESGVEKTSLRYATAANAR